VRELGWTGPVFLVSALTGDGTRELCQAVMVYLEAHPRVLEEFSGPATIDWSDLDGEE